MLDFNRHNEFADLSAALARTCANAAMRTIIATASHGLLLWSGFLAASVPKAPLSEWQSPAAMVENVMRLSPFGWMASPSPASIRPMWAWPSVDAVRTASVPAAMAMDPAPFASYRSAGGHATAQVIVLRRPQA